MIWVKRVSSLLEMNEPTLEENSITFTLPSKVSLSEFEKEREAFTIFLQKELNNYNIKVLSKIEEKKMEIIFLLLQKINKAN